MATKIIRLPAVLERTGLSKTSIYRLIKAGQFPRQAKLGPRAIGWEQSAVEEWIAQRFAQDKQAA